MGFRFRKTIKILPGVKINLSKSGISTSIGVRGATVNIGKHGTRATVGLPGTGISHSEKLSDPTHSAAESQASIDAADAVPKSGSKLAWFIIVVVAGFIAYGMLNR